MGRGRGEDTAPGLRGQTNGLQSNASSADSDNNSAKQVIMSDSQTQPLPKLKSLNEAQLREQIRVELDGEYERLEKACDLFALLHSGQTRKDPVQGREQTPYIEHCFRNTLRLIRSTVTDEDVLIATAGHDTVEDTSRAYAKSVGKGDLTLAECHELLSSVLRSEFGNRVADLIKSVTNPPETKAWHSRPDSEKFAEYQLRVAEEIAADGGTFLVKYADFVDNAGSLHWTPNEHTPRAERLAIKYLPLVEVFRRELRKHDLSLYGVTAEGIERMDLTLANIGVRLTALHP